MEIEATLIICSKDPQGIAKQIADLTSIRTYRLLPQDSKTIHDLYFDTPELALKARNLSLRIREIGKKSWVTLKGQSQRTGCGTVKRMEIEEPWSESALTRIVRELTDSNIQIPYKFNDLHRDNPLDFMLSIGLELLQERETQRELRNIIRSETRSLILAEMAIDSVAYNLKELPVWHYEVEIEAKVREEASQVLQTVIENLIAMFGAMLRSWDHSKLATGKAIEKLLAEGALEGLIDVHNNLEPVAYDKIDEYLKRRKNSSGSIRIDNSTRQ